MLTLKEQVLGGVGVRTGGEAGQELTGRIGKERQLVAAGGAGWPVRRPGEF